MFKKDVKKGEVVHINKVVLGRQVTMHHDGTVTATSGPNMSGVTITRSSGVVVEAPASTGSQPKPVTFSSSSTAHKSSAATEADSLAIIGAGDEEEPILERYSKVPESFRLENVDIKYNQYQVTIGLIERNTDQSHIVMMKEVHTKCGRINLGSSELNLRCKPLSITRDFEATELMMHVLKEKGMLTSGPKPGKS